MKHILVFLHDGYADYEASYLLTFLYSSKEGTFNTISPLGDSVVSKGGLKTHIDFNYKDEIDPSIYDGFVLIGGSYWRRNDYKDDKLVELINKFIAANKFVGAICDASTFLANNGFYHEKYHSGNGLEYIKSTVASYKDEKYYIEKQCVVDFPLISAGGSAGVEFGYEICNLLNIKSKEERDFWFNFMRKGLYNK